MAFDIFKTDSVSISDNSFESVGSKYSDRSARAFTQARRIPPPQGFTQRPARMVDGLGFELEDSYPRGRKYMLVNEWGPFNFEYPGLFLRNVTTDEERSTYTFALFGPSGNWKLVSARGFDAANPKSGAVPGTIELSHPRDSNLLEINLTYLGDSFIDQFGDTVAKGTEVPLTYRAVEPASDWKMEFYNYFSDLEPAAVLDTLATLEQSEPVATIESPKLANRWWRSPAEGVNADRFATKASGTLSLEPGLYRITIESDDGVRLLIDGQEVLSHWDVHTPAIDHVEVNLGGEHHFVLYHYDAGGLAVLDLEIELIGAAQSQ